MRNLENIPVEEENEEIKPENIPSENIDFSEQSKEAISEEKVEILKQEQEQSEQPEFKKEIEAVEKQEEEIKTQIKERDDRGILSSLSQKGRKFAGLALLSLSSFSAGCHKETNIPRTPELGILTPVKMTLTESPSENRVITREGRFTRKEHTTKDIKRNKEDPIPGNSISPEYGFERDLDNTDKQTDSQEKQIDKQTEEKVEEEPIPGNSISPEYGFKEDSGDTEEQSYSQEKQTKRQTERRVMENFRYFIKGSTVVGLEDGSFAIDVGRKEGNDDRVVVDTGERPCYKVKPEDLADMERIRQEHFKKIDFALSKRPFIPTEVIEGIRKKTERSLKRAIAYCEKIPQEQLPEEIKKLRVREQEEFKDKKEKIIAKNKENMAGRKELEKNKAEKTGLETRKELIRETPDQKFKRIKKEIKEIKTRTPRETPAQKFESIRRYSRGK